MPSRCCLLVLRFNLLGRLASIETAQMRSLELGRSSFNLLGRLASIETIVAESDAISELV